MAGEYIFHIYHLKCLWIIQIKIIDMGSLDGVQKMNLEPQISIWD